MGEIFGLMLVAVYAIALLGAVAAPFILARRWMKVIGRPPGLILTSYQVLAVAVMITWLVVLGEPYAPVPGTLAAPVSAALFLWFGIRFQFWIGVAASALVLVLSLALLIRIAPGWRRIVLTVVSGVALVAIPIALQGAREESRIRTAAAQIGFDCYFVRSFADSLMYGTSEYPLYHGWGRRGGVAFYWSYDARAWVADPRGPEVGRPTSAPPGEPNCH